MVKWAKDEAAIIGHDLGWKHAAFIEANGNALDEDRTITEIRDDIRPSYITDETDIWSYNDAFDAGMEDFEEEQNEAAWRSETEQGL